MFTEDAEHFAIAKSCLKQCIAVHDAESTDNPEMNKQIDSSFFSAFEKGVKNCKWIIGSKKYGEEAWQIRVKLNMIHCSMFMDDHYRKSSLKHANTLVKKFPDNLENWEIRAMVGKVLDREDIVEESMRKVNGEEEPVKDEKEEESWW